MAAGGGGGGGGGTGSFPVTFLNNTRGTWANSQIYITVMGMGTPGEWSYLKSNGTLAHINVAEENAVGHLTKNGRNYANMSFTLAQAATMNVPPRLEGGRMYISLGSPMYFPISPDNRGWGGPDLHNSGDPNIDVHFDWYEFTYFYGQIPFGGNTTQVDMFGFPMTARLQQTAIGYDQTVGITLTRDQARSQYTAAVGPAFDPLLSTYRIVAPRSSPLFKPGGASANFLQPTIDSVWAQYTSNQFTLNLPGRVFSGRVTNGRLQFTKERHRTLLPQQTVHKGHRGMLRNPRLSRNGHHRARTRRRTLRRLQPWRGRQHGQLVQRPGLLPSLSSQE